MRKRFGWDSTAMSKAARFLALDELVAKFWTNYPLHHAGRDIEEKLSMMRRTTEDVKERE